MSNIVELRSQSDGNLVFRYRHPDLTRDLILLNSRPGGNVLVLDTNVARGASNTPAPGKYTLQTQKAIAIPGNLIVELCTKIDSKEEFNSRQKAAKKILALTPFVFPQSSVYLRWLFGYANESQLLQDVDVWAQNLAHFATIASFSEWSSDKSFQQLTLQRSNGYKMWKTDFDAAFKNTTEISKKKEYSDLTGKPQRDREASFDTADYLDGVLKNLEERFTNGNTKLVSEKNRSFAYRELNTYSRLLLEYSKEVFLKDGGNVEENDRGDVDIMLFASNASPLVGGHKAIVLTCELDWIRLFKAIGKLGIVESPIKRLGLKN